VIKHFAGFVSLGLAAIILSPAKPSIAQSLISRCFEAAREVDLPTALCDGEVSKVTKDTIYKLSQNQSRFKVATIAGYLRQLGYLRSARTVINFALDREPNNAELRLSAANITQAEYKVLVAGADDGFDPDARYEANTRGLNLAQQTLMEYKSLIGIMQTPQEIKASLNWLRFWVELNENLDRIAQFKQENRETFKNLAISISNRLSPRKITENTEIGLFYLESLIKANVLTSELNTIATTRTTHLLGQIDPSQKPRSFARVLAMQGALYKRKSQTNAAIESYARARNYALSINATELAYQWEVELGRLYLQQSDRSNARKMYRAAIDHISSLRNGRLSLPQDLQYRFGDSVSFVYREYQDLLFSDPNPDYQEIIAVYEKQRISELENYLKCEKLDTVSLRELPPERQPAATLYLIARTNRYELLLRLRDGTVHQHSISSNQLNIVLEDAKKYLTDYLQYVPSDTLKSVFGKLYTTTVGTVDRWLPNEGTIVFVLDTKMQNFPWAALYTPQNKFLIEQYSVSYSFGSELRNRSSLTPKQQTAFAGGVSDPIAGKTALPQVVTEVKGIAQIFPKSKILLNADFRSDALIKSAMTASIIHIASHGEFSSDPSSTYILGWNGRINLRAFEEFVKQRLQNPIDLLFFSACESARGDKRSVLGLSGTAVRAGARSAIASLWSPDDEAMARMALDFYAALSGGKPKSEALREAQIKALSSENPNFSNFANWSALILVGAWD
jgi:CHAT domain-containing protein